MVNTITVCYYGTDDSIFILSNLANLSYLLLSYSLKQKKFFAWKLNAYTLQQLNIMTGLLTPAKFYNKWQNERH
jgi:hypothetical protein